MVFSDLALPAEAGLAKAGNRFPSPITSGKFFAAPWARDTVFQDSSGDQAGSEAKLGVGSFNSLRPVTSMVKR